MNSKYQYNETELREKVKQSINMRHLLSLYEIVPAGGNYGTMKLRLKQFNIDTSHWGTVKQRQGHLKGKKHNWSTKIPLIQVMVKDSTYITTSSLKKRLFSENIFEKKCYKCGITEWLGLPAPLELEHISGDKCDNRKENLTILCANCHSQTPTYRRRKSSL